MMPASPSPERSGGKAASESREQAGSAPASNTGAQGLDPSQLKLLSQLKSRDREVRAHESAHQAVGGQYAGAVSYTYQRGPDGAQYAVGGEVSIDTAPVEGNPQATIAKMQTVRAAALAPAEPSAQDQAVAAQAMQLMLQARAELATESAEEGSESGQSSTSGGSGDSGDEADSGLRINQNASATYQSISGLVEAGDAQLPSSPIQATA
ncbi:putative metalloprotease CJM1_0395 family protein [Marinobacter halotolerans]|uniref:putative metalloprotease CJM1_0395 family protein n=1 Tax=Marinobacter halotolerans TaxID=1569211 RepID=UPI001CD9EF65|nr:putative metalloprotease CJM1_0395 family protein [Marinobacter halotolerans]